MSTGELSEAEQAVRDARIKQRNQLWAEYKACMQRGTEYQRKATAMHNESEPAAESYVEMRKDFRARSGNDGYGDATNDYKYSQYSDAKKAVGDNQWYMQRAIMFAGLAQMEFAKAAALMQNIVRIEAKL